MPVQAWFWIRNFLVSFTPTLCKAWVIVKTKYKLFWLADFCSNFFQNFSSRVKQAIAKKEDVVTQLKQQYQAAVKRADHLEGLLQQQRKQLLSK